jgi:hypothetical protein
MNKEEKGFKSSLPEKRETIKENNPANPETKQVSRLLDYLPLYKEDEFNKEELCEQIEGIKSSSGFVPVPGHEGHYDFSLDADTRGQEIIKKLDDMHEKLINLKSQYEKALKDNNIANKKDIETILSKINEKLGTGSGSSLEQKIDKFKYDFLRGSLVFQ